MEMRLGVVTSFICVVRLLFFLIFFLVLSSYLPLATTTFPFSSLTASPTPLSAPFTHGNHWRLPQLPPPTAHPPVLFSVVLIATAHSPVLFGGVLSATAHPPSPAPHRHRPPTGGSSRSSAVLGGAASDLVVVTESHLVVTCSHMCGSSEVGRVGHPNFATPLGPKYCGNTL